jgi:hypothetical protein
MAMEQLDVLRKRKRRAVSKLIETLEDQLKEVPLPTLLIEATMVGLENLLPKLSELNEEVEKLMVTDPDMTEEKWNEEDDGIADLNGRSNLIRTKVSRALTPPFAPHTSEGSVHDSNSTSSHKRNFKLPKVELRKFSGELKDWLGWWAQFQKIDEDDKLHDSDKFSYLLQAMIEGSRAMDVVKRFPQSTENYPKAVAALKERFGNKKLLK